MRWLFPDMVMGCRGKDFPLVTNCRKNCSMRGGAADAGRQKNQSAGVRSHGNQLCVNGYTGGQYSADKSGAVVIVSRLISVFV